MAKHHTFVRDEVLPSWWANAIQEGLSGATTNLRLERASDSAVQVAAGSGSAQIGVVIQGRWRWRTSTIQRAHGGGSSGVYDVFAVAAANNIVDDPENFTDATNYDFDLRIVPTGNTPALVPGTVDLFVKVGELDWSGAAITGLRQTLGPCTGAMLADGAVGASGRVSVTRQPGGALLLDVVDGSINTAELADAAVTAAKIGGEQVTLAKLAATVAQALVPTGALMPTARAVASAGYLMADGAAVTAAHPDLRAALIADGSRYGADGSGNPRLPDLRGKFPVGLNAAESEWNVLGEVGGAKTVTLTEAQMPEHAHESAAAGVDSWISDSAVFTGHSLATGGTRQVVAAAAESAGSGAPHPNLPPYIAINWMVKT